MPGDEDDETADGECTWFVEALGPQEKNQKTYDCGPCSTLIKNHYSVPVKWVNLFKLTVEFAIFKVWPTAQNRIAVAHLLPLSGLKWAKQEGDLLYMTREMYDLAVEQVGR
uniref:Uncharacterized protein n=1 Tax=Calcidiscus leptoporus TaxID=127549 RepID=A0A7S0NR32_9EUKA|mmetsp:Transcript_17937/g.41108  ORF Transcript_17937/g.41108 Transcript_17937/m.41108 type:complete len:111 (+) Transcript_17937:687-1019(+)